MKVVSVAQMQRIEAASDALGHSCAEMMERAGRAVAQAIGERTAVAGAHVLVLVGPGNNGGDGLVAARHLADAGAYVVCYLLKPRDPATDENHRLVVGTGLTAVCADEDTDLRRLRHAAAEANVIVDSLLGTGTRLPLRRRLVEVLDQVGQAVEERRTAATHSLISPSIPQPDRAEGPIVVAVDGPTGLEYDTGALSPAAITADTTVTFAHPKQGHFRFPGAGAVGKLIVADIGTDPILAADVQLEVADSTMVRGMLPSRPPDAHKGTFGKALVVAGSANYTGAAYLAASAATRIGAGLVTVGLPGAIHSAIAARLAEATYLLLPHDLGAISAGAADLVASWAGDYDGLLLGPGLGRDGCTREFVAALLGGPLQRGAIGFGAGGGGALAHADLPPMVLDADGLNIVAELDGWPERLPAESILTPHPGEMARLMGCSIGDVQASRVAVAREQADQWGHVVVLKGAHTVVAAPGGRIAIQPFANAGLATAGTGDVLAGAIVGLRVQGLGPYEAAVAGSYVHGLAGEMARAEVGVAGMVAGDVLTYLPQALRCVAGP